MKELRVPYLDKFRCVADRCRHNCCIGWEIRIDPESLSKYDNTGGLLGNKLKENIITSPDGEGSFRLASGNRCHFLNDENLCELIIEKGDDYLCEICREHPRFYNIYPGYMETGIGISCEKALELMLENEESYVLGAEDLENEFLKYKYELLEMLERQDLSLEEKCEEISNRLQIEKPDISMWREFLSEFDYIDSGWIDILGKSPSEEAGFVPEERKLLQFLLYLVFRNFNDSGMAFEELAYCIIIFEMMKSVISEYGHVLGFREIMRLYSQEIEYSDVNQDRIYMKIQEEYPD